MISLSIWLLTASCFNIISMNLLRAPFSFMMQEWVQHPFMNVTRELYRSTWRQKQMDSRVEEQQQQQKEHLDSVLNDCCWSLSPCLVQSYLLLLLDPSSRFGFASLVLWGWLSKALWGEAKSDAFDRFSRFRLWIDFLCCCSLVRVDSFSLREVCAQSIERTLSSKTPRNVMEWYMVL
jgi:hypothetical protein